MRMRELCLEFASVGCERTVRGGSGFVDAGSLVGRPQLA